MNRKIHFAMLMALALVSGCFSVRTTQLPEGGTHTLVRNYGWYLFYSLPLACGNAENDPTFPFVLFRDDVTCDKIQRRLMSEFEGKNGVPGELTWHNNDSVILQVPGTSMSIPIPYLICYRELQLSGVQK